MLAEFSEIEGVTYSDLSIEYKVALLYSRGTSFRQIEEQLGIHRMYVKRNIMKALNVWIKSQQIDVLEAEKREEAPIPAT
jgi:transposase-like protein